MFTAILFAFLTSVCSGLHGGDYATKGVVVAFHAVMAALLCSVYAIVPVALFWLFLRRGNQAIAEINYIYGIGGLDKVKDAYPAFIGNIMNPVIKHSTHVWWFGLSPRRCQEVFGGFVLGLVVYSPLLILGLIT